MPQGLSYAIAADAVVLPASLDDGARFGDAVTTGDFNHDGLDDLAVGAPLQGASDAGAVHVWFGQVGFVAACPGTGCGGGNNPTVLDGDADVVIFGSAGAKLGGALATVPDLDGDDDEELLIGGAAGAWVVDVSTALPQATLVPMLTLVPPDPAPGGFGYLVGATEVDGQPLLVVGQRDAYVVHVYHELELDPASASLSVRWVTGGTRVIASGAPAGDWDDDGHGDLAFGCPSCPVAEGNLLILGGLDLLDGVDLSRVDGLTYAGPTSSNTGQALADFPDGRLAVGASHLQTSQGRVTVIDEDVSVDANGVMTGGGQLLGTAEGWLGMSTAVGDPENDGVFDVVGGAPDAKNGVNVRGMVRFGAAPGVTGTVSSPWHMIGPAGGADGTRFGKIVRMADLNGDFFDDVIVAAPKLVEGGVTSGGLFLVLGGVDGYQALTYEVWLDEDGDGFGDTSEGSVWRCDVPDGYATQAGDCDDDAELVHAGRLENCVTVGDDDCLLTNDQVCDDRVGLAPIGPPVSLQGSTWCAADGPGTTWAIGPAGEQASILGLAQMVSDQTLFFHTPLAAGVAAASTTASACPTSGVRVLLDVIERYAEDDDLVETRFAPIVTNNAATTLRNHPDGYLIGTIEHVGGVTIGVLGGSYTGLVHGVVDLLRSVEGDTSWKHRTVLDWPENPVRVINSEPYFIGCATAAVPFTLSALATCQDSFTPWMREEIVDQALRLHFTHLRSALTRVGPATDFVDDPVIGYTTAAQQQILYLRQRGMDVEPFLSAVPNDAEVPGEGTLDPLGVLDLPVVPVAAMDGEDYAFPCDTSDCSEVLDDSEPDWLFNRKYAMPTDGAMQGVVYARNLVTHAAKQGSVTECLHSGVTTVCAGGPCWCTSTGATNGRDFTLAGGQSASLVFGSPPSTSPNATHDDQYALWGPAAFRPGRLYAMYATATATGGDATAKITTTGSDAWLATFTNVSVGVGSPVNLHFVARAPLQGSLLPNGEPSKLYGTPGWSIHVEAGGGVAVAFTQVVVVELDGLSNGWLEHPELGGSAVEADQAGWDNATHAEVVAGPVVPCPVDECIPYSRSRICQDLSNPPVATAVPWVQTRDLDRFAPLSASEMPAPRLTRILLPDPGVAHLRGQVGATVGWHPHLACEWLPSLAAWRQEVGALTPAGKLAGSIQVSEVFDPVWWEGPTGLGTELRYLAKTRSELGGHSLRDYLFGEDSPGDPFGWRDDSPRVYFDVLDEVRGMNRGFAGWHDDVYRVIPHAAVLRGLFCNLANLVDDEDWLDEDVPFFGLCDYFSADGNDCFTDETTPSLFEDVRCALDRPGFEGSSGVRIHVDSGHNRDSTTFDARGDPHMALGSLSPSPSTASMSLAEAEVPTTWTTSNTVSNIQDSRIWLGTADKQELFEALCDVADISDVFLDHPGIGPLFEASDQDRNACMMTGRSHPGQVQGDAAGGAPETVRSWSILAAGVPGVVNEVTVGRFNAGSSGYLDDHPYWAMGAECAWNPGWSTMAVVSMATARTDAAASRLCEPGTAWASTRTTPTANQLRTLYPIETNYAADGKDMLTNSGSSLLVAMKPTLAGMVKLPADAGGRTVRVEVAASIRPNNASLGPDSCSVAQALASGSHEVLMAGPAVLTGPPLGALYFADMAGNILTDGAPLGPLTCQSPIDLFATFGRPVEIRPLITLLTTDAMASLSVQAVVPEGAVYLGFAWQVPNCDAPQECRPSLGAVSIEIETAPDPALAPAYGVSSGAWFPHNAALGIGDQPWAPSSCGSRAWHRVAAVEAPILMWNPAYFTEQHDCLEDYADGVWP